VAAANLLDIVVVDVVVSHLGIAVLAAVEKAVVAAAVEKAAVAVDAVDAFLLVENSAAVAAFLLVETAADVAVAADCDQIDKLQCFDIDYQTCKVSY